MPPESMPGVPAGGLRTIGQIHPTNDLVFRKGQNALGIAVELLTSHTPGAPVVNEQNEFIGFVSEFDVLRALQAHRDLSRLKAEDIMVHDRIAVTETTTIEEAVKMMEDNRLLNLPVIRNGTVSYSITRHDLLRAWIGLGMDIENKAA